MLQLGSKVSVSSTKTLAASTAATSFREATAGKQFTGDTSCHHLSKRDLAYFSSEKFAKTLKLAEDNQLAKEYGKLIARRKSWNALDMAHDMVDAIIYVDIFDAHCDGFSFSFEEVRDLFKGYRSQALRELKTAKGFNALVYRELADALDNKKEIRSFLKAINSPILRKEAIL